VNLVSVSTRRAFAALAGTTVALTLFAGTDLAGAASRAPGNLVAAAETSQPYPIANGDAFTYAITQTETVSYPSATPSSMTSTSTESYVDACPVTFNGLSNLCDQQQVFSNEPGAEDEFYGYVPGHGTSTQLNFYGVIDWYVDGPYTETETEMYSPFVVFAQFPQNRHERFNEFDDTEQYESTTSGPNRYSSVVNGVTQPSGSYRYITKTVQPKQHLTTQITSLVRGNASAEYELKQTGYNPLSESFGTPISVGGQEVIPVTTQGGNQLPATPPPAVTVNVPDWFPGGGAPPHPLENGPTHYLGMATVPAACGAYAGTQAGDLRSVYFELDPLGGWVLSGIQDSYFADGVGEGVCYTQTFSMAYYDNLNSGQLLYTDSGTNVWVLTNEYLPDVRMRGPAWPGVLSQSRTSLDARNRGPGRLNFLGVSGMHPSRSALRTLGARFAESRSTLPE
jgi:hypothetical protein